MTIFICWLSCSCNPCRAKMELRTFYPFQTIFSFVDFPIFRYFKMNVGHTDGSRTRSRTQVTLIGSQIVTLTHSHSTLKKVSGCVCVPGG